MNDAEKYNDIIHLSRPKSKKYPPMSEVERAAQFSPFAALKGYDEEIEEAARFVEDRRELDEDHLFAMSEALLLLRAKGGRPTIKVTFFKRDERKEGGAFTTLSGKVKKIDEDRRLLQIEGEMVPFDDIVEIEITE